jgi:RNAse (barnase) inhibitor barstar
MGIPMSPFRFDGGELPSSPALLAEVPAGVRTKEALLEELYQRLHCPDYFGGNWDALWECIRDFSWLPAGAVVLRHRDLPLADDIAGRKKYVSILKDAVEKRWLVPGQQRRDLVVVFPAEMQDKIAWLLRSIDHDENPTV